MSKPATPRSRQAIDELGDLAGAGLVPHRGQQLADDDPCRRCAAIPSSKPALDRGDDLVEVEPAGDVLLGGVADLGVHDAVGGQVLDALAGDPRQRLGRLHHRDRVVEGLEVPLQRAGVGRLGEPATERRRRRARAAAWPISRGQLEDRRRPQPSVEVVVQQDLGRAVDLLAGGGRSAVSARRSCRRFCQTGQRCADAHLHHARRARRRRRRGARHQRLAEIDQDRVDLFADATGDHQWIHVDVERATAGRSAAPSPTAT